MVAHEKPDILAGLPPFYHQGVTGDAMKERYPYLVYWEKRGFDKFPTVPPDVILKRGEDAFRRSIRNGD